MKNDLIYAKYNGEKKCPKCQHPVFGYPALSRVDNRTYICSVCGTNEALQIFFDYNKLKKQG